MAFYENVDATKKHRLGTRRKAVNGNEYVYLAGVASCAASSWVTIAASWVAVLAVANAQGMVAVANAAVLAANWGWFTIWGVQDALCLASFDGTNGAGTYLTSTAGSVDDADVSGDAVFGAIGLTDRDTTTGTASFSLSYPYVIDLAAD